MTPPAFLPLDPLDDAEAAEAHRRWLLTESDRLLDYLEELRLRGGRSLPEALAEAVRRLHLRLGRAQVGRPRTLAGAQELVFLAQQRLMAANPRNRQARRPAGRPGGSPVVARLKGGVTWKFLTLPPRPAEAEDGWRQLVGLTVERALDRWCLAQDRAVAAARTHDGAQAAVSRAQAAWTNYWELRCEAESLLSPPARVIRLPLERHLQSSRWSRSSSAT
jgi:hypothetical protein